MERDAHSSIAIRVPICFVGEHAEQDWWVNMCCGWKAYASHLHADMFDSTPAARPDRTSVRPASGTHTLGALADFDYSMANEISDPQMRDTIEKGIVVNDKNRKQGHDSRSRTLART